MSGLFSALSSAAGALAVQQHGLETVGQNIANVNTPGYSRRVDDFAEVASGDVNSAGAGVEVQDIRSIRDLFAEQRLWREQPQEQENATVANLLSITQAAFGTGSQGIDTNLGAMFDAFAQLAQDPTSGTARQAVQQQAQALGDAFRAVSGQFTAVQGEADQQVRSSITQVRDLSAKIAALNTSMSAVGGGKTPQGQVITDQLHETISSLSGILDIGVVTLADGQVDISYSGGRALVVGGKNYSPTVVSMPVTGLASVRAADGTDVTSSLTTGSIGGLLRVRDSIVPGYARQLDTLASTVVQQVNAVHATGFDLNGAPAGNLFTPIAAVAGASNLVNLDPTIAADPSKIAAAGAANAGDNQVARSLANLRDAKVIGGVSTLAQGWGTLIYQVGQDVSSAQAAQNTHADIVGQLQTLRDAASGVSIDEEGTMMLKYQRAYQANAKLFTTVNATIDTLLALIP